MMKEYGVHRLSNWIVASEREGDVRQSAACFRARALTFYVSDCFDEIDRVVIVLLHTGRDREDVQIENDVVRIHPHFINEDTIGAFCDFNFALLAVCLSLLVKSHHDNGSTIPH